MVNIEREQYDLKAKVKLKNTPKVKDKISRAVNKGNRVNWLLSIELRE
jgi:hypothetical protein